MQRRLTDLPTESVSVVPVSYRFTAKSLDDVYGSLPAGEEEADRHSHLPGENRLSGLLAVEAARRIIKHCNVGFCYISALILPGRSAQDLLHFVPHLCIVTTYLQI